MRKHRFKGILYTSCRAIDIFPGRLLVFVSVFQVTFLLFRKNQCVSSKYHLKFAFSIKTITVTPCKLYFSVIQTGTALVVCGMW